MNSTQFAPKAVGMSQSGTAPTSADPAGDSFAGAVQDILHAYGYDTRSEAGEVAQAVINAYASRIAAERRRSDAAAAELRILVDRDRAKDMILGQMKTVVGQTVTANARAFAHIAHLSGQVEAVRQLLDRGGEPVMTLPREDLEHIIMERQFRGVPDQQVVAGFSTSREYSMGRFAREYAATPVHLPFVGWSLVVGSTHRLPVASLLDATFQLEGRPVPASFLAHSHGLSLQQLLP